MRTGQPRVLVLLLGVVVMSSLVQLLYGFSLRGAFIILQVPTTLAEIAFVLAVIGRLGPRTLVAPLTGTQRVLLSMLILYVLFVTIQSQLPTSFLFAPAWIVHILFFVALLSLFSDQDAVPGDTIWMVVGLTALVHVCAFLIAWATWPDVIRERTVPAFGNVRHLGYFLAPAAAAMAAYFLTRRDKAILALLCFAASVFYIAYTGSRGGAVALVAGLAVTGVVMAWQTQQVQLPRAVVLIGVAALVTVVSELLPALPWTSLFGEGADMLAVETGAEVLNGRDAVWLGTIGAIRENWLWGYGSALMSTVPTYDGPSYYHPHNIGLQLFLHWGALGTLVILITILTFIPSIWRALHQRPEATLLPFAALITMAIHSLVDGGLFYPYSTVIAIIAFASLVRIGALQRDLQDLPDRGHSAAVLRVEAG